MPARPGFASIPLTAAALAIGAAIPTTLQAQGIDGLFYSGSVRLGQAYDGDSGDSLRYGAFDLTAEYGFAQGFGVGLDAFGFVDLEDTDFPRDYFNLYAYYETDVWRVSVGHTESASELLLFDERIGFGYRFDTQIRQGFENIIELFYVFEETIYGVTYEADYGDLEVAASLHAPDNFDNSILSVATRVDLQDRYYLSSGVEFLTQAQTGSEPTYRLGAGFADQGIEVDALLTVAPQFIPDVTTFGLDARYTLPQLEELTIGASFLTLNSTFSDTQFYGLGAAYTHASGLGLQGNALLTDDGDAQYDVEINFRF